MARGQFSVGPDLEFGAAAVAVDVRFLDFPSLTHNGQRARSATNGAVGEDIAHRTCTRCPAN